MQRMSTIVDTTKVNKGTSCSTSSDHRRSRSVRVQRNLGALVRMTGPCSCTEYYRLVQCLAQSVDLTLAATSIIPSEGFGHYKSVDYPIIIAATPHERRRQERRRQCQR